MQTALYIHLPFCKHKCNYCDFASFAGRESFIPAYLDALAKEAAHGTPVPVQTVYVGGGTPSLLSAEQLYRLCGIIRRYCGGIAALEESTLEANPESLTPQKIRLLREAGFNRLSLGLQSFDDKELQVLGRVHDVKTFLNAFSQAREGGFFNINVDLIAGLPGERPESFIRSLEQVLSLAPENLTVHTFYVKRGASITKTDREIYRVQDGETTAAVGTSTVIVQASGYIPYYLYRQKNTAANLENTGYMLPGHPCLYNIYMMEEIHSIFGAGASAMTKLVSPVRGKKDILRISEKKYPYEYLAERDAGEKAEQLYQVAADFYRNFKEK